MADRSHHFDLKLLTASKDVGLRRLRSYAASLGGGAQIFHSFEDLRRHLEATAGNRQQSVVLHDNTLPITAAETATLACLSRVFHLHQPQGLADQQMPLPSSPCWELESFMRCSLPMLLDSQVVRMSMANLVKAEGAFHLEHLLRWGHAAQCWTATAGESQDERAKSLADASMAFIRSLSLAGEARRLTEMASHFLQSRLRGLGLTPESATFGADGLTTTVITRCAADRSLRLSTVAEDLRVHDFPVAIVNRLEDGQIEIAALHHSGHPAGSERIVMIFRKDLVADTRASAPDTSDGVIPPKLEKAG